MVSFCDTIVRGCLMARIEDELMGLLASRETWTGRGLADALGVSLRTVRRALVRLEAEGVPIEAEPGRGGGLRLAGGGLHRLKLNHREVMDLLLALAIAESIGSPLLLKSVRSVRTRLGAAFPPGHRRAISRLRSRILVGAPASTAVASTWRSPRTKVVGALQDAFFERVVVGFDYVDGDGRRSRRVAEPQALLLNPPVWYALCWDRHREAGRAFRLDRIEAITPTAEAFTERPLDRLHDELDRFFQPL
jgi:predicted DNA-binding transcriptional regulator YafY